MSLVDGDPPTVPNLDANPDTMPHVDGSVPGDEPEPRPERLEDPTRASGAYSFGAVLGRGGMGEVVLAHDRRIGRDVAVKRLRAPAPSDDDIARFLREARIQARLDHPAIVPVYELARDEQGRPYFTMKRLAGVTLAEMLASPVPTRQRLLRAFVDVCRAIDFAHSRGVVHRDLKPANIVLGEFGEVYVLDWGVARVVADVPEVVTADIDTLEGSAPEGHVLGTPGYMAPDQLRTGDVGRPADVYALGSILFEILAGELLHPRHHQSAIDSTLSPDTVVSPARRRPDRGIAPELDGICVAMLAMDPKARPTVRRVADRVEAYLDGDRDVERRRTLALDLVWSARAALDDERRADAMRAASRALALDPEVDGAGELLTTLMLEPPREPPPELAVAIREAEGVGVSAHARAAVPGYLTIAAFMPIAIWNGVVRWGFLVAILVIALALAGWAYRILRRPDRAFAEMLGYAVLNALLVIMIGRLAGPFAFVPALMCFITMSMITYPCFVRRPWALITIMVLGYLTPLGLEATGAIASTWEVVPDGGMLIKSGAIETGRRSAGIMMALASVVTIFMAALQSLRISRANRSAQQQLVVQAWHLRQLLPPPTSGRDSIPSIPQAISGGTFG